MSDPDNPYFPIPKRIVQDVPNGDDLPFHRAGGDCVCEACGKTYNRHLLASRPLSGMDGLPFLHVLCNGDLVKL